MTLSNVTYVDEVFFDTLIVDTDRMNKTQFLMRKHWRSAHGVNAKMYRSLLSKALFGLNKKKMKGERESAGVMNYWSIKKASKTRPKLESIQANLSVHPFLYLCERFPL